MKPTLIGEGSRRIRVETVALSGAVSTGGRIRTGTETVQVLYYYIDFLFMLRTSWVVLLLSDSRHQLGPSSQPVRLLLDSPFTRFRGWNNDILPVDVHMSTSRFRSYIHVSMRLVMSFPFLPPSMPIRKQLFWECVSSVHVFAHHGI